MSDEQIAVATRLAIYNPEKVVERRPMRNLFESLYGAAPEPPGDYDIFEFCSAKCALLAVQTQALLEV